MSNAILMYSNCILQCISCRTSRKAISRPIVTGLESTTVNIMVDRDRHL